jgi:hypothetical protein
MIFGNAEAICIFFGEKEQLSIGRGYGDAFRIIVLLERF